VHLGVLRLPFFNSSTACTIATSIVHSKFVIVSTINCRSLSYPVSSSSRTLLLLSPVIFYYSHSINAFSTGSESLNASNTSSCHLPTNVSQLPTISSYTHLYVERPRSTCSSFVVNLAQPPTSSTLKITDSLGLYILVSRINSLFVNLILVPVPPFPTYLFLHPSRLPFWFATLLIHNSLSFTPGLPVSQILPSVVSLLPQGLPSWTFVRAVSSELLGFCYLVFPYFFWFLCHALDWAGHLVSFWAHAIYRIVSYRMDIKCGWAQLTYVNLLTCYLLISNNCYRPRHILIAVGVKAASILLREFTTVLFSIWKTIAVFLKESRHQ